MSATPTPWIVKACGHGFDDHPDCCLEIVPESDPNKDIAGVFLDNAGSAGLPADEGKANAALICQAVNAHGPLVEALGKLIDASRYLSDEYTEKYLEEWCDCEPCPGCGKAPKDCTGTACAETCECKECRNCHLRMATVDVGEAIESARAALKLARGES